MTVRHTCKKCGKEYDVLIIPNPFPNDEQFDQSQKCPNCGVMIETKTKKDGTFTIKEL